MDAMLIILGIIIFSAGILIGYFLRMYVLYRSTYDGLVVIAKDEDKLLYSLELEINPEDIQYKNELILKVQPLDEFLERM